MEEDLWRKTTFDGRGPLTEDYLWWKTTFDRRGPLMEDALWWKTTFDGRQHLFCRHKFFFHTKHFFWVHLRVHFFSVPNIFFQNPHINSRARFYLSGVWHWRPSLVWVFFVKFSVKSRHSRHANNGVSWYTCYHFQNICRTLSKFDKFSWNFLSILTNLWSNYSD